jgi:hypothetical protein
MHFCNTTTHIMVAFSDHMKQVTLVISISHCIKQTTVCSRFPHKRFKKWSQRSVAPQRWRPARSRNISVISESTEMQLASGNDRAGLGGAEVNGLAAQRVAYNWNQP